MPREQLMEMMSQLLLEQAAVQLEAQKTTSETLKELKFKQLVDISARADALKLLASNENVTRQGFVT